jgi:S-methylmethionine-dependent homocysteine/selenocysteine methylase
MEELRERHDDARAPIVISGCLGPQDDGYNPSQILSAGEAEAYHRAQIRTFAETAADMVTAITMNYAEEAVGVTRAARAAGMPVAIGFTVETDGRLPSGQALAEAIAQVDAEADGGPAYYLINCAHPSHFEGVVDDPGAWRERIRGLRANASTMSHAELDEATELDDGDPVDLGSRYASLAAKLPNLSVIGGCCGTDVRHVRAACEAWPARVGA